MCGVVCPLAALEIEPRHRHVPPDEIATFTLNRYGDDAAIGVGVLGADVQADPTIDVRLLIS